MDDELVRLRSKAERLEAQAVDLLRDLGVSEGATPDRRALPEVAG